MRLSETQKIKKIKKTAIKIINKKKKEYKYLTYPIDCSYGKAILTKIKSEHLDLLPKITLQFDIPKDKAEEYIKNNGINYIKKQIANSIGDNNFSIIGIVFGSLFVQIVFLGPLSKEKVYNFLQNKEWDGGRLKEIKEKLQNTIFDFGFLAVKPKYAELCNSKVKRDEAEKIINKVLQLSEKKSDSADATKNEDNYLVKTADQIIETLTEIAQEKEMQETKLTELNEDLKLKESLEKTNNFLEQKLKESIFEFKIVGLNVVNNINKDKYLDRKSRCQNCESLILIQGTKAKHAANSLSNQFITGRDNWYGIGTYFTDQLDYATYYAGETKTFGHIPKIGDTK